MADNVLGTDLQLDSTGDLNVSPSGDLALVSGIADVWQATVLRLLTTLGTYLFESGYGTTLRHGIGSPMTAQLQTQIQNQINTTVLSDPRVQQITALTVAQRSDLSGYDVSLSFLVTSGQIASGSFSLT